MPKTITIDTSGAGSAGVNFATFIADYFQGLTNGAYKFYGGTPDLVGSPPRTYYLNGEQIAFNYKESGADTSDRIVIGGTNLAYDYFHHGSSYGHGISGQADSLIFGNWGGGTTGTQGTGPSGSITGLEEILKITGLDLNVAPGSGIVTNDLYKLYDALQKGNFTFIEQLLSGYSQNFIGSEGDDIYSGTSFDDTVDGGDGEDIVYFDGVYGGPSATHTHTVGANGELIVTDNRTNGGTGNDTLTNVEILKFNNLTFNVLTHDINYTPTDLELSDNTIDENSAVDTEVAVLSADDLENNPLTYTLTDDAGGKFKLVTAGGQTKLVVAGTLDHETTASYTIKVKVFDGVNETEKTFTISVNDVNEAPSEPALSKTNVIESAAVDTEVGTLSATDPENDTLTYSLTDDAGGKFKIVTTGGQAKLVVADALDHGTATSHTVTVRVSDGSLTTDKTFSITVGANEPPTNLSLSKSSVDEDATVNTEVGILSATDPENDPLTYSLTDDASGKFKIVTTGGQTKLVVADTLDYETATSHTVKVKVSDGTNEVEKTFTIAVGDVADGTDQSRGTSTLDASGSNGIDFDAFLLGQFLKGTALEGYPGLNNNNKEMFFSYGSQSTSKYALAFGAFEYDMSTHKISGKIDSVEYGTRGTGSFGTNNAFTGGNVQLRISGLDLANSAGSETLSLFSKVHMAGNSATTADLALYLQYLKQYAQNVIGSKGADTYVGTRFNDTVKGNGGNDTIDGGLGEDTFVLNGAKADYTWVQNTNGTWTVTDKRTGSNDGVDTIKGIEKLKFSDETVTIGTPEVSDIIEGTAGDDALPGTSRSDRILGHAGNDKLYGQGGHDVLNGGEGNDQLFGGTGNDQMYGGAGNDVLYGGTGNDEAFGGAGNDQLFGGVGKDIVYGGAGKDVLYGGTGNDELYGGEDNDDLYGGDGKDELQGGEGHDKLRGGEGNDVIEGGAGNDRLVGGKGADLLTGGAGRDTFVFNTLADSTVKTSGRDTILNFDGKAGDRIDLSGIDANKGSSGNQAFAFIGSEQFSNKAGELRFEKTASDTFIYGDVDGDGTADFAIQVAGRTTFLKDYFVL